MAPAPPDDATRAYAKGPELTGSPQSVKAFLDDAVSQYSNETALVSLHQRSDAFSSGDPHVSNKDNLRYTYRELLKQATTLAAALYAQGLRPGQSIATFLYNSAEFALVFWAAASLNAPFVPLDPKAVTRTGEVRHYFRVIKPAVLVIADEEMLGALKQNHESEIQGLKIKVVCSTSSKKVPGWSLMNELFQVSERDLSVSAEVFPKIPVDVEKDVVFVIFTSGTSGPPKACPHTHRNLWAAFMGDRSTRRIESSHRLLQHLPASHIFGCLNMVAFWYVGAGVVFPSNVFDAGSSINAIEQEKCTHMGVVPPIVKALISHPTFSPNKTRSLQHIGLGGTLISPAVGKVCQDEAGLGARIAVPGFGMSEGMPILAWLTHLEMVVENGFSSVGKAVAGVQVKICPLRSHECLKRGEIGELHVGGPIVIGGYLTGENGNFYEEGGCHWLATGDQAKMDSSGAIFILGRYKDIIIRGGENLSPAVIEACINTKFPILMVQVIGIPDETAGEVPAAVVQVPDGVSPYVERIQAIVREGLGQSAVPETIITLQDLGEQAFPMTTSGKVRKNQLKHIVLQYIKSQEQKRPKVANASTEEVILETVAQLLGQSSKQLPRDVSLAALLDSISLMRFCDQAGKKLSRNVTMEDLMETHSMDELARQIESRGMASQSGTNMTNTRNGPLNVSDMIYGDENEFVKTQALAQPKLEQQGMTWDADVEDVYPVVGTACYGWLKEVPFSHQMTAMTQMTDSQQLRHALETSLKSWPIFRSVAVEFDQAMRIFVVFHASKRYFDTAISIHPEVETPEALSQINIPAEHLSGSLPKGLLFRAVIAKVTSTGTLGLVVMINHATYDFLSLAAWAKDLDQLLKGETPLPRVPYKLFADAFYLHQTSILALKATIFTVHHLSGISALQDAFWPSLASSLARNAEKKQRKDLPEGLSSHDKDKSEESSGLLIKSRRCHHLSDFGTTHGISAPIILKAAISLFNTHMTGNPNAIFGMLMAGRVWPFIEEPLAQLLPNPLNIAGPTMTGTVNITKVDAQEKVIQFLKRIEAEHQEMTRYQHRPMAAIAQLSDHDRAAWMGAMRQFYNWQPSSEESNKGELAEPALELMQQTKQEANATRGFIWECGLTGFETLSVRALWNLDLFSKDEVNGFVESVLNIVEWICDPSNCEEEVQRFRDVVIA